MYRFGIFGKPNVGKSSLFNALISQNKSLIARERGVTRDSVRGVLRGDPTSLTLSDLAGWDAETKPLDKENIYFAVEEYLKKELKDLDALVVVFDINDVTTEDHVIYEIVKSLSATLPKVFVANKVDNEKNENLMGDLYELGNEQFTFVSALGKRNLAGLREVLFDLASTLEKKKTPSKATNNLATEVEGSLAIIGKPNVGKSSFLNALLSEERSIVRAESGTTRDAIDDYFFYQDKKYKIIDTAGLRKKSAVRSSNKNFLEKVSLKKTFHAINQADVVLLLIDAKEVEDNFYLLSEQDKRLITLASSKKKTLLIYFNKWDLVKDKSKLGWKNYTKQIGKLFPYMKGFPLFPISCKGFFSSRKKNSTLKDILSRLEKHQKEIKTKDLNNALHYAIDSLDYNLGKKKLKVYYANQIKTSPPLLQIFINNEKYLENKITRYLKNFLVQHFDLQGIPIGLKFKAKIIGEKNDYSRK